MNIENITQFRAEVDSLNNKMNILKGWQGKGSSEQINTLVTVERDIGSLQAAITTLARKNLIESDFIETSKALVGVIDGVDDLRNRCKIIDYKQLSFFGRIAKFFKQFFGGYTYVAVDEPIDVVKTKEKVILDVKEVLKDLAPKIEGDVPEYLSKNVWGVEVNGDDVFICIWEKDKAVFKAPVTITEKGVQFLETPYDSWEKAFDAIKTKNNIQGSFENVKTAKEKSEKELVKFTIEKVPAEFEGKWFIKKEGEVPYYNKTGEEKKPIFIGLDGFFQAEGKGIANSIPDLFKVREEDCMTKVYEKRKEKALEALLPISVEGTYKDRKISLVSGGGPKNIPHDKEGNIIVIDRKLVKYSLISVDSEHTVKETPLEIQEDGQYSFPIKIENFDLGGMKKIFVQNEENKLKKIIKDQVEKQIEKQIGELQKKPAFIWKTREKEGYRFVYSDIQKLATRIVAGDKKAILEMAQSYAPMVAEELVKMLGEVTKSPVVDTNMKGLIARALAGVRGTFLGSVNSVASIQIKGIAKKIGEAPPQGYSVHFFGSNQSRFIKLEVKEDCFFLEISPGKVLQDISLDGLMKKIEVECNVDDFNSVQKDISEKEKKYNEAIQVIKPIKILSSENEWFDEEIKKRFEFAREASESVLGETSVWNAPYFACTWYRDKRLEGLSIMPKDKNKECVHITLDVEKEPGKIWAQFPDGIKSISSAEFRGEIEKLYKGIVFPEVWDREYRNIEPFINEIQSLGLDKGGLNAFKEKAAFLEKNAEGAVYADCSGKVGNITFHIAGLEKGEPINLLECVKTGKLIIKGTQYDSIKAYLEVCTGKALITPKALKKLANDKDCQVSALLREAKEVDEKTWNTVIETLEGEKSRVWEIVSKPMQGSTKYRSLSLRIAKEGLLPLSFKDFDSMDKIIEEQHLKKEDRYGEAIKRKEKVEALGSLLMMGEQTGWRTTKKHNYFYALTKDGEKELFLKMAERSQELQKPLVAIYKKGNKYYRATLEAPYKDVQSKEIVIHTADVPYFSIANEKTSGRNVYDLIPEGMIDLVEAENIKNSRRNGVERLGSLLVGKNKVWGRTTREHNYFYALTRGGEEDLFAKMISQAQEIQKPIVAIYKKDNKYYRAIVAEPYNTVLQEEIVISLVEDPFFFIKGKLEKGRTVQDVIPKGMIDLVEAEKIKNRNIELAKKFSLRESYYGLFSTIKKSFFTSFSSFEEAEKASQSCLPKLENKKLFMVFLDNEGKICLLTRTSAENSVKKYHITEENGILFLEREPNDGNVFDYASFSALCEKAVERSGGLVSYTDVKPNK